MSYELLPYTNQLIKKYPDQGRQLFQRHGYHIRHPRYRDYYNGMQTGGFAFFDDLLKTVGSIWGKGGLASQGTFTRPAAIPSPVGLGSASIASPSLSIPAGLGFDGEESNYGDRRDNDRHHQERIRQYYQLLHHFQREAYYEQLPINYITTLESNGEYVNAPTEAPPPPPTALDNLSMSWAMHKKQIIIGAIVIAIAIWWFKFRR